MTGSVDWELVRRSLPASPASLLEAEAELARTELARLQCEALNLQSQQQANLRARQDCFRLIERADKARRERES